MKETIKSYLFSNFDFSLAPECVSEDKLISKTISNLTMQNKVIEPLSEFTSLFYDILGEEGFNNLLTNGSDVFYSLILATIFEYYDEDLNKKSFRIVAISSSLQLYEFNFETGVFVSDDITLTSFPDIFIHNSKLFINDHSGNYIVFINDYFPLIITSMPKVKKIVNFKLYNYFLTEDDPYTIYGSNEKNNIEDLSSLDSLPTLKVNPADGEIIDIFLYKNNLYVVQNYAILKLVHTATLFSLCAFCSINARIIPNTINTNDDYVVFMTSDGLYIFDGNDIKKIFIEETKLINGHISKSVTFNNKYYLLTEFLVDGNNQTSILEFDLQNLICNVFSAEEVNDIFVVKSSNLYKLCISKHLNSSEKIFSLNPSIYTSNHKLLKFSPLTFNNFYEKLLTHIKLSAKGRFVIKIKSDVTSFSLSAMGNVDLKNIGLRGNYFEIEISSDENFVISSIYFRVTNIEE